MSQDNMDGDVVICRACVSECADYKSLYQPGLILGSVTTLASLMGFCTNLDFPADEDFLPSHICARCIQNLAKSYVFKNQVLEANEILRAHHSEVISCDVEEVLEQEHQEHHLVDDIEEAMELQELANVAEMKRDYENGEYVTLSVLQVDKHDEGGEEDNNTIEEEGHDLEERLEEEVYHIGGVMHTEEVGEDEVVIVHETEEVYHGEEHEEAQDEFISLKVEEEDVEEQEETEDETETFEVTLEGEEHSSYVSVDQPGDQQTTTTTVTRKRCISSSAENEPIVGIGEPKPKRIHNRSGSAKPPNPDLQCQICQKQLSNHNSFKYHMQLHSDTTPFLCSLCGDGFKTRNAYEGHMLTHDPNNPNTCTLCGKAYRQASSLRSHMLTHTGEKPYQCDICGKGMTQKSGYKKHLLTHTGEKPHTCNICGRDFRYSSNMIAHKRCHTGEKPYECVHCGKCFTSTEQMKRHAVVHTGERNYQCELCDKSFKRRSSLMSHRQTHETMPPELENMKLSKSNVVELY